MRPRNVALLALICVCAGALAEESCQGAPIPRRFDGVAYDVGGSKCSFDMPILEVFIDIQCPDSRDAWKGLVQLMGELASRKQALCLLVHQMPLPYHSNSFIASQTNIIRALGRKDAFFEAIGYLFERQGEFSGKAAFEKSPAAMTAYFAKVADRFGVDPQRFYEAVAAGDFNMDLRVSWKAAVARGVYGTPFFFLNSVALQDPSPSWSPDRWRKFLADYL